jgi:hypothetical protein
MATNPYFNASGIPGQGSKVTSPQLRAELAAIAAGFALLPALAGNAGQLVVVNAGATALESSSALTVSGANITLGGTLTVPGAVALNGGLTVGNAPGDALTINSSAVSIPNGLNFDSNTLVINAANNTVSIGAAAAGTGTVLQVGGTIRSSENAGGAILLEDLDQADGSRPFWYLQSNAGELLVVSANRSGTGTTGSASRFIFDTSNNFKPAANNAQSNGTAALQWSDVRSVLGTFTGAISSSLAGTGYTQTSNNTGGINDLIVQNTGTSGNSSARLLVSASSGTGGDAYTAYAASSVSWSTGIDRSAGSIFVISAGAEPGTNNVFQASTAGNIIIPLGTLSVTGGNVDVTRSVAGGFSSLNIENTSGSASSRAALGITAANGDAFVQYNAPAQSWSLGVDVSAANAFVGSVNAGLGTANWLSVATSGAVTFPDADGVTVTGPLTASGGVTGALTGNASTATALQTARNINGVAFDGTANITVTAAAGTLTGATLAAGVTGSSLTSVGTLGSLTVSGTVTAGAFSGPLTGAVTGNASTATTLQTARNINGVSFNGSANITVAAAAGTLTGATLAAGVTGSSLTSVGTLGSLTVSGATALASLTTSGNVTLGDAAGDTITVTGTPSGQVVGNTTWTPTILATANISGTPVVSGQKYARTGSTVTFSFFLSDVDPTLGSTLTTITIAPPIASNFGTPTDVIGVANRISSFAQTPGLRADEVNKGIQFAMVTSDDIASGQEYFCVGQYTII